MVRLIAFDLEGTLVKSVSSWVELHKKFGTWDKGKEYAERFFAGEFDYATWAELDTLLWKGHTKEEIMEWANSVEYMDGAWELIEFLRKNNFKIAILSSGLMCLARRIASELGVDYVFANELIFDENGVITGEVNPAVDFQSKGKILENLKKELDPELTVAVGDGYNDLSMFSVADVSIAINPHEGVEGDHNVESLHEVMEIIKELLG
ncbi:HAD family hydrolase [Thermococcus sp. GR7]|uniref:HAD-IB family phosphatase n=1 Tax=unclassified Thermococcus TaxID=2627626 RepID=UPI0014314F1F|nr:MULTISPECIES: HAD-IB family phosphatase [unclassified Thermococcus]NJE47504.1 HAD family hydrolase [Thermococcus sp. GR7]NJE78568.1 HAD family hydrolase [Thermococcus sp. GR4]NJF23554.1 HAD family hydrolase [Thermococcus sp. GR5]